jgi:protein TonB
MHALEEEPEKRNRWKRLLSGVGIAVGLAAGMLVAAQQVVPAHRLMPEILQMAIVDEPPPPPKQDVPLPPPPPPPPKAPPKQKAQPEEASKPVEQPPPEQAQADPQQEPEAGLDATSFGGGNGAAFHVGTTQMGDPNRAARFDPPKPSLSAPPKLHVARASDPQMPEYPERARRLNIQGSVLIEAEIDERGQVRGLRVRQGLEQGLDEIAVASVRRWRFQPATLEGRAVPSTHLIRIRFELD